MKLEGWRAARKGQSLGSEAQRKQGKHPRLWSDRERQQSLNGFDGSPMIFVATWLNGHGGEQEPVRFLSGDGILVAFSDGRAAVLQERKALLERSTRWHPEQISIYQGSGEGS